MRSTIYTWIQTCPSCGYCAPDVSEPMEQAQDVIKTDAYQQQLKNQEFPKLANRFLCYSLIQERAGNFAKAGWSGINAAWACDDNGSSSSAVKCRENAIRLLNSAKEHSQSFAKQDGGEEALISDLLRRSNQFEEAAKICEVGLSKGPEDLIKAVLRFEKKLIDSKDNACHLVSEAVNENQDSSA
jgi:hypothetical protein